MVKGYVTNSSLNLDKFMYVINSSLNLDKFMFSLAPMTYCNYCVIQMLKSQQQQQQEYPILGPLSLRIAVKKEQNVRNAFL